MFLLIIISFICLFNIVVLVYELSPLAQPLTLNMVQQKCVYYYKLCKYWLLKN